MAPTPSGPVPADSAPAKPGDVPPLVVKVLEPGEPPRRELRYSFQGGAVEHFEADVRVASLRTHDGRRLEEFEPPTFRMNGRLEAQSRDPEGVVFFAVVIDHWELLDDVKIEPDVRRQVETELVELNGVLGSIWVSPRGQVLGLRFQARKAFDRMKPLLMALDEVFHRGFVQFPSEAVGVGAKWDVESIDDATEVNPVRHDVFSLLEADEGGATLERSSSCSATPQPLPPPRETVQLDVYDVKSSGQLHPFFTNFIGGGYSSSAQLRMEASSRGLVASRIVWTHGSIVHVRPARHDVPR